MPTPRPFNAPTSFTPSPMTEINQQVLRMQNLTGQTPTPASAPQTGLSAFTQKILGIGNKAFNAASGTKPMKSMKAKPSVKSPALPKGVGMSNFITSLIPDEAYDSVANEIIRGGLTVLGKDTTGIDNIISGRPVVKSVGTTDFNVNTPEGMAAYQKALKSSKAVDPKKNSGDGLNTSSGKITSAPIPQAENNPTTYGSFQEQQDALMASRSEGVNPLTAMLIRGIPKHPFSSTQLPTTSNNPYAALPEDSTYMEETVKQGLQNYGEFIAPDNLPLGTEEAFASPVNYELGNPSEIDSMTAMRMKERDQGLMYASGQYFAAGKDGKPVLVNRDLAKAVKMGEEGARQELDAYLAGGGISPIGSEATPGFGVISNPSRDLM